MWSMNPEPHGQSYLNYLSKNELDGAFWSSVRNCGSHHFPAPTPAILADAWKSKQCGALSFATTPSHVKTRDSMFTPENSRASWPLFEMARCLGHLGTLMNFAKILLDWFILFHIDSFFSLDSCDCATLSSRLRQNATEERHLHNRLDSRMALGNSNRN